LIKHRFLLAAITVTATLLFPASGSGSDTGDPKPPAYVIYSIDPETGKYRSSMPSLETPADDMARTVSSPGLMAEVGEEHLPTPVVIGAALLLFASAAVILTMKFRKRPRRT
jgi:hypothetical protein